MNTIWNPFSCSEECRLCGQSLFITSSMQIYLYLYSISSGFLNHWFPKTILSYQTSPSVFRQYYNFHNFSGVMLIITPGSGPIFVQILLLENDFLLLIYACPSQFSCFRISDILTILWILSADFYYWDSRTCLLLFWFINSSS